MQNETKDTAKATAGTLFPIEDAGNVPQTTYDEIVDFIKKNGKIAQVKHIAEEVFGIDPQDENAEGLLAQALRRVAELYEAGGIRVALHDASAT